MPLASVEARLQETQTRRYPRVFTETDAAGDFAFEALEAGNYQCFIAGQEQHAERFALAAGEVREVTLQSRLVALTLLFLRRGEPVQDCVVECNESKGFRTLRTDKSGVIRVFTAPGRCELTVRLERHLHHSPTPGPYLSRHVLLVPERVPALQWSCEIGGTELAFAVGDPKGQAIDTYTVYIDGIGAFDQEPGSYVLFGTPGKPAAMAALPAGKWRATVTSDGFRLEPRDFVTGLGDGLETLSFVASPAAYVRLTLRETSPFFTDPEPRHMPPLVVDACAVSCTRPGPMALAKGHFMRNPGTPLVFEYCAVPPGKVTLLFQDRIEGDELVPLPFEPIAPVTIDVAIGCANEVAVDVEPRAFVDLRGCDASGVEMPTAVLTVWVDGRRVRNRDAKTSQQWLGWLPPGVHRVVIDRNGTQREHLLRVEHMRVRERYRP